MRTAFHYLRQFIYQDKEGKEVLGSQAIVRVKATLTSTRWVQSTLRDQQRGHKNARVTRDVVYKAF